MFLFEELGYRLLAGWAGLVSGRSHPPAKVLVNGVPKSGTTWVYRLIDSVPGYTHVGNFKGDLGRYDSVRPGDVIHSHDWPTPALTAALERNHIRVVCVSRDPRDQLVSRMFHLKRDTEHRWQPIIAKMNEDEALMLCIEGRPAGNNLPLLPGAVAWIEFTHQWQQKFPHACHLHYERLLANTEEETRRLFRYLGVEVSGRLHQAIIRRNRFERASVGQKIWQKARQPGQADDKSHFRKGITGDWRNYFQPHHSQRFKELTGNALIELGYETNNNW